MDHPPRLEPPCLPFSTFGICAVVLVGNVPSPCPLMLVNISVIFGMVVMPFTYYPILRVAADKNIMGKHVNSRADTTIAIVCLILICIAATAAIPLMALTHSGKP